MSCSFQQFHSNIYYNLDYWSHERKVGDFVKSLRVGPTVTNTIFTVIKNHWV